MTKTDASYGNFKIWSTFWYGDVIDDVMSV